MEEDQGDGLWRSLAVTWRRLVPVVAVLALVGCNGGTVDRHALTNDAATLDSIACEGAVVANGVARGRTTVVFAREQAEELQIQASNLADALGRRPTVSGLETRVRQKARDAAEIAGLLQRLHDHPGDRTAGAALERALKSAGNCS
jgi:hypothetical protein